MLPSNSDKKSLIEAMKKLAYHISNNPRRQKEIFDSLGSDDLKKMALNLADDNQYLRRVSALLFCQLLHSNNALKLELTAKLDISLNSGRICLGGIPSALQQSPLSLQKCLVLLKQPQQSGESGAFCWAISLDRKQLELEFFPFKKYSSFTFLDPQRCVFGVTVDSSTSSTIETNREISSYETVQPRQRHQMKYSAIYQTPMRVSDLDSRRQVSADKDEVFQRLKKIRELRENKNKEREIEDKIPLSQRVKTEALWSPTPKTTLTAKREGPNGQFMVNQPQSSRQKAGSYSREQIANNSFRKPIGNSIQSISQYARSSYGQKSKPDRARQSMSFNMDQVASKGQKEILTDRSSHAQSYHENFYKRVQDILRK